MSKIYLIPETSDIIEELGKLILNENFDEILIVFPGERPASYLYNYLGEKIKSSFFPPKTLSMNRFIDYILSKSEFSKYTEMSEIDALYYLYKIYKNYKNFDEFEKFIPYGKRVLKFIDELDYEFDEDIDLEKFQSIKDEIIKEDIENIMKIRREFHEKLKKDKKFVEGFYGFKYFIADKIIEENFEILNDYKKIYFVGIYGITNIERKIIKKIIEGKTTILLWQSVNDEEFLKKQKFNIEIEKIYNDEKKKQNIEIFSSQNSLIQFIKVREILENLKSKNNLKNTCVVLPENKSLIPFLSCIDPESITHDYNIGLKFDIKNTVHYSFVESLIECILSVKTADKKIFLNSKKYLNLIKNPLANIKNFSLDSPFVDIKELMEVEISNSEETEKIKRINNA
ncbi:MAG: hypothetical protein ACK4YO_02785, partial [Candidatus Altarchaeaceae archaeon]